MLWITMPVIVGLSCVIGRALKLGEAIKSAPCSMPFVMVNVVMMGLVGSERALSV